MRINSVTYAKAFAIILMVLAHARIFQYGQYWINMFHMPLFFMMSGYCFKFSYLDDVKGFIAKRFSGIYVPFVKWSILFLLLHNFFFHLNIYSDEFGFRGQVSELYTLKDIIIKAFSLVFALGNSEQLLGGYWFLRELFLGSIIFYVTVLFTSKRPYIGGGILLIVNIALLAVGSQTNFYGARTVLAALFIWVGFIVRNQGLILYRKSWFPVLGFSLVTLGAFFWQASCLSVSLITYIPFVVTAIFGSLSVFYLCEAMDGSEDNIGKRVLRFIGENTLTILTWHFLSFKLISLIIIWLNDLPIKRLSEFPVIEEYAQGGWWVVYSIVGILVPLLLAWLNKYIPSRYLKL